MKIRKMDDLITLLRPHRVTWKTSRAAATIRTNAAPRNSSVTQFWSRERPRAVLIGTAADCDLCCSGYVRKRDCACAGKIADCRRGRTPDSDNSRRCSPLHSEPPPNRSAGSLSHSAAFHSGSLPETGGMKRTRHASCRCHEPRQLRPLRGVSCYNRLRFSGLAPLRSPLHRIHSFALTSPSSQGARAWCPP
jgi:hypothetical protein